MRLTLAELQERLQDYEFFARNFLKIKPKKGYELINLEYNVAQKRVNAVWDELEAQGKPVRLIILKARREGVSTGVAGRFSHRLDTQKNLNAQVIAHNDDSTNEIFEIYRLMYEKLPKVKTVDGKIVNLKPLKRYSNRKELVFKRLGTQIRITTAGKDRGKGIGKASGTKRGATIHLLHCSEVAFWPNAGETLLAVLQAVADVPGTVVVLESTANGVGGEFYNRWLDAKAGRSDYVPIFLSWLDFPEYRYPVPPDGLGELDEEEKRLKERFGATDEQLMWRRRTIRNECGGDPERFRQEYPADDEEAFLVAGRPYFNRAAVVAMRDTHERPPTWVGNLEWRSDGQGQRWVEFVEQPGGYLAVWAKPKPYGCYAIGADVAEGREDRQDVDKYDYSVAEVLDRDTFEQAAEWRGHIDPDEFGRELVKLATWYNQAWLAPESNKDGLAVCRSIVRERYPRLFERERLDERDPDQTEKLGWLTNAQTRPVMLADLEEVIRTGSLQAHSYVFITECLTFVRDEKGRPAAQEGCHDDTVMAMAIAVQVHKARPMSRPETPEERRRREQIRQALRQPKVSKITKY